MTANCLCGAVSITIDAKPEFIHVCNCSLCRKSGGAWGYFPSAIVKTTGDTVSFLRRDKENAAAELQSCTRCGTTTHWTFSKSFREQNEGVDLMGVNMRIFNPDDLQGVEVRFPDGAGWSGEGPFEYRHKAMTISDGWPW
ncbi:aldehyde-activating protein [Pelagibius litoralis]|uniref:Aldehyde-activating protein n=1 Tax=Pelagibius litoralis TaxID=374515 RepID=A0A967F1M0_9PROT|nr:GFA family protein [Pelagibius litoralis]NIA71439.1 aldehyde-activating protein [Pelagibius litoralis]